MKMVNISEHMLTKSPSQCWLIKTIHECSFIFHIQISLNFSWGQVQPRTQQRRKSVKIGFPTSWCRIRLLHGDWIKLTEYRTPKQENQGIVQSSPAAKRYNSQESLETLTNISEAAKCMVLRSLLASESHCIYCLTTAYLTPVYTKWIIALFFFPTFPISKSFSY